MSSLWKRLENGLECWGEGSEEADFWLDRSLDWKESRMGGYDYAPAPQFPLI